MRRLRCCPAGNIADQIRRRGKELVTREWEPTFTTELLRMDSGPGRAGATALEVPVLSGSCQVITALLYATHNP